MSPTVWLRSTRRDQDGLPFCFVLARFDFNLVAPTRAPSLHIVERDTTGPDDRKVTYNNIQRRDLARGFTVKACLALDDQATTRTAAVGAFALALWNAASRKTGGGPLYVQLQVVPRIDRENGVGPPRDYGPRHT
jgi:hypothetical protein